MHCVDAWRSSDLVLFGNGYIIILMFVLYDSYPYATKKQLTKKVNS
jgi:hypothetical protein